MYITFNIVLMLFTEGPTTGYYRWMRRNEYYVAEFVEVEPGVHTVLVEVG